MYERKFRFGSFVNRLVLVSTLALGMGGCMGAVEGSASQDGTATTPDGETTQALRSSGTRRPRGTGGSLGSGGSFATGGAPGTGGASATGGAPGTGGASATGGASGTGGAAAVPPSAHQQRPSYNTGTGFFVVGSKLYDANGNDFRIRGLNHLHWDSPSIGIPKTGANTERWDIDFNQPIANNIALMQKSIANKLVPMPGAWEGTCDDGTASLSGIVGKWVATAAQWKAVEKHVLINIANEWGPSNSTIWRDQYIAAVAALRAAGIKSTLVVDAGGCGQNNLDLTQYAAAVLNSDPQKNILFSQHIYGGWQASNAQAWQTDLNQGLDALAATGLAVVIGEFGPGRNIGPSPTLITPAQLIGGAEARGLGWLAWAWDDPAGEYTSPPEDAWFALSFTGDYRSSADLTTFGKDVVENATYGLRALARPASVF